MLITTARGCCTLETKNIIWMRQRNFMGTFHLVSLNIKRHQSKGGNLTKIIQLLLPLNILKWHWYPLYCQRVVVTIIARRHCLTAAETPAFSYTTACTQEYMWQWCAEGKPHLVSLGKKSGFVFSLERSGDTRKPQTTLWEYGFCSNIHLAHYHLSPRLSVKSPSQNSTVIFSHVVVLFKTLTKSPLPKVPEVFMWALRLWPGHSPFSNAAPFLLFSSYNGGGKLSICGFWPLWA